MTKELLEKTTVHFSIQNGGDGSVYPRWFLTDEEASQDQEDEEEGWGEDCSGSVETYVGSDIHSKAMRNRMRSTLSKVCDGQPLVDVIDYMEKLDLKYFIRKDENGYASELPEYNPDLIFIFHDGTTVDRVNLWG